MLSKSLVIEDGYLINTCKYRQSECCRYIVAFPTGDDGAVEFFCVKNIPDLRKVIDNQSQMNAKGDNCEGLIYAPRQSPEGTSE